METIRIARLSAVKYRVNDKVVVAYGQHVVSAQSLTPNEENALKAFVASDRKIASTICSVP